jgi:integrase
LAQGTNEHRSSGRAAKLGPLIHPHLRRQPSQADQAACPSAHNAIAAQRPESSARDAQIILGHAHIATTQQIYTHVDEAARLDAITKLNKLLGGTD